MTLSTMLNDVVDQIGVARPSSYISGTDQTARTLVALANSEGLTLARKIDWTNLVKEATHTTLAAESQGTLESIIDGGEDFDYIVNDTLWDRTQIYRNMGPNSPQSWQRVKANVSVGPYSAFRIWDGTLYLYPAPPAGNTLAFEYKTKHWVENAAGDTSYERWNADTDVSRLDEDLMKLGIIWRFKQSKGFDYAEDMRTYELEVAKAMARDGGKRVLNMGDPIDFVPNLTAPEGSWNL
jgi:hypothetical protein